MTLFPKILIANRGEIAARIIRTAKKMNIATVAVYAAEERDALHVRLADQSRELEGESLAETYLNIEQIIKIAKDTGASAIHPGYGFLSENEDFAGACEERGITFIGPRSETIALMGNKTRARAAAVNAGLPVIEGHIGTPGELARKGGEMKFPLLVKAAAGGGGKGMRIVTSPADLAGAIEATGREAKAYFGNDTVYLEQYIEDPRHIEVQVLCDKQGNTIHLFERECSIQRRYQKIIEESPSPSVSTGMRQAMCDAAVKLAREIKYCNAGTIEFLADNNGNFWFLEMNTRIQVEHPVTEAITGIDLVEEQILIASGNMLRYSPEQVKINGHAIECRIYAEDPEAGFIPLPGKMTCYRQPEEDGVRVDAAYDNNGEVSGRYDPMLAKLITHGSNREDARKKMVSALHNFGIHGIKNNISFLLGILGNEDFITSRFSTTWCEENAGKIISDREKIKSLLNWQIPALSILLASFKRKTGKNNLWESFGYWRVTEKLKFCFEGEIVEAGIFITGENHFKISLNGDMYEGKYRFDNKLMHIEFNGEEHTVFISENSEGQYITTCRGYDYFFRRFDFLKIKDSFTFSGDDHYSGPGAVYSPMPGRVIKIYKAAGSEVIRGDVLVVVESMKMENNIKSPSNGIIDSIDIKEGELIDGTSPLMTIKQNNEK